MICTDILLKHSKFESNLSQSELQRTSDMLRSLKQQQTALTTLNCSISITKQRVPNISVV